MYFCILTYKVSISTLATPFFLVYCYFVSIQCLFKRFFIPYFTMDRSFQFTVLLLGNFIFSSTNQVTVFHCW